MASSTILFDLDGTLVDSAPDLADAANLLRTIRGLPPIDESLLRPLASRGSLVLIEKALGTTSSELKTEFLRNYAAICAHRSRLYPGLSSILNSLHESGIKLGVVTNKPGTLARTIISSLGLNDIFSGVWGSGDPGIQMKPAPSGILSALENLESLPSESIYIGDEPSDLNAAHAAGLRCALVRWGYACEPLETVGPDFIAETPKLLEAWLLQQIA